MTLRKKEGKTRAECNNNNDCAHLPKRVKWERKEQKAPRRQEIADKSDAHDEQKV